VKKLVIIATAGLLLSGGAAFSQATPQKDAPAQSGAFQPAPSTKSQSAPATQSNSQRSGASTQTGERRQGAEGGARREGAEHGERRGERSERHEGRERTGINIRVDGNRDGYRHRRGYGFVRYGSRCRVMIVKSFHHGHRVIKRIRRCR
jgi:hypothetical protein